MSMLTFTDLIEQIGGAHGLADGLGIPMSHARTMKARKSVPPEYWPALVKLARSKRIVGVNLEALSAMRANRYAREAA